MLTSEVKSSSELQQPEKRASGKSTVRKLTLYSVLPPQGILSQLESGYVAEPNDKTTVLTMWAKASQAYNTEGSALRSYVEADDIREIDDVNPEIVEEVLNKAKLYAPHDTHATSIYKVRISKLVTPQITINESRAEKRAAIRSGMSTAELFPVMFESAGKPEPITRQTLAMMQGGGTLLSTSYDEDIRLHHPPHYRQLPVNDKDPNSPSFENICFAVGGGCLLHQHSDSRFLQALLV